VSTTPPKPKDKLALAAARLSKAAPNAWVEFMSDFGEYVRDRELACVQAPSDRVLNAQGRAQQLQELCSLLLDAAKQK